MLRLHTNPYSNTEQKNINPPNNQIDNQKDIDARFFTCKTCSEKIIINPDPSNFTISYICPKNHKETEIPFENFCSETYITVKEKIFCKKCQQEIKETFYRFTKKEKKYDLCKNCILANDSKKYAGGNFVLVEQNNNKCKLHYLKFSYYCKTCNENLCKYCIEKTIVHKNHLIKEFENLIPSKEEIKNNENILKEKMNINKKLIEKFNIWKKEMTEWIDNIIKKLESETKIYKIIQKNFNNQISDYHSLMNYNSIFNSLKYYNSEFFKKFMESISFFEKTKVIYKNIKQINNDKIKESEYNINNSNNMDSSGNENNNINLINILNNDEKIICYKESLFLVNKKNERKPIDLQKIDKNEKENRILSKNIIELNNSLFNKIPDSAILIWKIGKEEEKSIEKVENFSIQQNSNINRNDSQNAIIYNDLNYSNKNNNLQNISGIIANNNISSSFYNSCNNLLTNIENKNKEKNDSIVIYNTLWNSKKHNSLKNNLNSQTINCIPEKDEEYNENKIVYKTKHGKKFHNKIKCGNMGEPIAITIKEAIVQGIKPCNKCNNYIHGS